MKLSPLARQILVAVVASVVASMVLEHLRAQRR